MTGKLVDRVVDGDGNRLILVDERRVGLRLVPVATGCVVTLDGRPASLLDLTPGDAVDASGDPITHLYARRA